MGCELLGLCVRLALFNRTDALVSLKSELTRGNSRESILAGIVAVLLYCYGYKLSDGSLRNLFPAVLAGYERQIVEDSRTVIYKISLAA